MHGPTCDGNSHGGVDYCLCQEPCCMVKVQTPEGFIVTRCICNQCGCGSHHHLPEASNVESV